MVYCRRFICRRDGDQVRVFSRNGRDWTDRVPLIAEALAKLQVRSVTIDGEGVVCRPDGVSYFDRLRAAVGRLGSRDAFLYAFDLLEINGTDLRRDAWDERRKVLVRLLRGVSNGIRLSEHIDGAGASIYQNACRNGPGRHRGQAAGSALPIGTLAGLDQGQEPKRTSGD